MFSSRDNCITKLLCLRGFFSMITNDKLNSKIDNLQFACKSLTNKDRSNNMYNQECFQCLRKLVNILQTSSRSQLQLFSPYNIINCSIQILHFYDDCWFYQTDTKWKILWKYEIAMVCYRILLKTFAPEKPKQVADVVFNSIVEENLWKIEDLCEAIIKDMLKFNISSALTSAELIDKIELNISHTDVVINLIGLLDKFLKSYKWPRKRDTDTLIERLLNLYHKVFTHDIDSTVELKKGLETCLKSLVNNLDNDSLLIVLKFMCQWIMSHNDLDDTIILDYGNLMEYVASKHETKLYIKTLCPDILPIILRMISSSKRLISLLGNRIIQHLIDRNKNKQHFNTPKIFLEDAKFDITISKCYYEDKIFVKSHREVIHDSIIKSIINHCSTCLNLETTYCTMCLIAVEIPCGFTSASLVCLAMNMQNLMLEEQSPPTETNYHIHAIVVSIMSLLCWIHKAKVFYEYVNKVIATRAHWAPHLNPPLQMRYEHAPHHILWNKAELFFVDWEVRYGLWKKFRLKNDERKLSNT